MSTRTERLIVEYSSSLSVSSRLRGTDLDIKTTNNPQTTTEQISRVRARLSVRNYMVSNDQLPTDH